MNDPSILPFAERVRQYAVLASDYFALAESSTIGSAGHNFLYLHSTELLLKNVILERHGETGRVPDWLRSRCGDNWEKTHDLAVLLGTLLTVEPDLVWLAGLDPRMVRFRYPGPDYPGDDPGLFADVQRVCRSVWDRLTGPANVFWRRPLVTRANTLAEHAHGSQNRKWGGQPYIIHPRRVAQLVAEQPWASEEAVAAGLLHDVLEDTDYPEESLRSEVGDAVVNLVVELSKPGKGGEWTALSRAEKRQRELEKLRRVSETAQRIKLCDRIDNLSGEMPADFRTTYLRETHDLVLVVGPADPLLLRRLQGMVRSDE